MSRRRCSPGLSVTLDYYDIEITDAIATYTPQVIVNECVNNDRLCEFVNRGASNGNLWLGSTPGDPNYGHVVARNANLAVLSTSGIDLDVRYGIDLPQGFGGLDLSTEMTYLLSSEFQNAPETSVNECVGVWSGDCEDPTYEIRNNFKATWNTPWDVDGTLGWRYVDEVTSLNSAHRNLDAVHYVDVSARYKLPVPGEVYLRGGINNILDQAPPLYGNGSEVNGNGNTWPGFYDALGQYWFLGLRATFGEG